MREHQTTVDNEKIQLVGTTCLPDGAGPFPFVVFVHGSGPLDRNENMPKQRLDIFNALAEAFASVGVASYRYDKRGCGESSGSFATAGLAELVSDAAACVSAVRGFESCSSVFLVGHSEGCAIAPLVTQQAVGAVDGLVLLCPFMPPVDTILMRQAEQLARDVDAQPALSRLLMRLVLFRMRDPMESQRRLIEKVRASNTPTIRAGFTKQPAKWLRELLALEGEHVFRNITCPTLLVAGEKDVQCDPADVERIREVLSGPVDAHVIQNLTHVLRIEPGVPSLLGTHKLLKQPIAPEVFELTARWLSQRTNPVALTHGRW